uniref:Uncharacterized protein n=1 Tax=Romanomermis culicivorax TaxID=13658 RepID=A0A915KKR7_ROMCU
MKISLKRDELGSAPVSSCDTTITAGQRRPAKYSRAIASILVAHFKKSSQLEIYPRRLYVLCAYYP